MNTIIRIDTVIIKDTVVKIVEKAALSSSDKIDIYKDILSSQTQIYNNLIIVFLGIIALFAGATWLYNKKIAKADIIAETDRIFKNEKEKLMKEFKTEYESELNFIKGERARLFALAINGNTGSDSMKRFLWWIEAVYYYIMVGKGEATRVCLEEAIKSMEVSLSSKLEGKKVYERLVGNLCKPVNEITALIPDVLNKEKKKLEGLLKNLND